MNEIEAIADDLRQGITNFLVPIQTTRVLNEDHFKSIISDLELLASKLKDVDLVSKSLLNEVFVTIKVIRAEALHFNEEKDTLINMADKIEFIFELILKDETTDQRKPGVPRVC